MTAQTIFKCSEENSEEDEDDFDKQENLRNAKRLLKSLNTSTQK